MKERLTGIGLIVGTALTLGVVWAAPAHAFSLGSTVTVQNFLRDSTTLKENAFQGPANVAVIQGQEPQLVQFGGIWNIDLGNNSISFTLNSKFGNVVSGDDVYRFSTSDFGQLSQLTKIEIFSYANFSADKRPFAKFRSVNELEVIFPLGFAPDGLLPPQPGSTPGLVTQLPIEPYAIPTPALLPGLLGMGLAVLRKQHRDDKDV